MECTVKITKPQIDKLVREYETSDFIKDDPILFPHRFSADKKDCEIAGFIASLMAYGNRKVFIKKMADLKSFSNMLMKTKIYILQTAKNT